MKPKFKINQKVKVNHSIYPFNGVIEQIKHYENPFSVLDKKGIEYGVRADDDNNLYSVKEHMNLIEVLC